MKQPAKLTKKKTEANLKKKNPYPVAVNGKVINQAVNTFHIAFQKKGQNETTEPQRQKKIPSIGIIFPLSWQKFFHAKNKEKNPEPEKTHRYKNKKKIEHNSTNLSFKERY